MTKSNITVLEDKDIKIDKEYYLEIIKKMKDGKNLANKSKPSIFQEWIDAFTSLMRRWNPWRKKENYNELYESLKTSESINTILFNDFETKLKNTSSNSNDKVFILKV